MSLDKAKMLELALKHLNVPGLLADVIDEVLEPALQKVVDDSENSYDNMLMAAAYPVLEAEMKKVINEKWLELSAPAVVA